VQLILDPTYTPLQVDFVEDITYKVQCLIHESLRSICDHNWEESQEFMIMAFTFGLD
jgi:hypothetical protein